LTGFNQTTGKPLSLMALFKNMGHIHSNILMSGELNRAFQNFSDDVVQPQEDLSPSKFSEREKKVDHDWIFKFQRFQLGRSGEDHI